MKNRGFTLLETIIYIGLFGILMSGFVAAAYQLLQNGDRNQLAVSVQEEGTFINRKINWALSNATEVTVDGATGALSIVRPDLLNQSPIMIAGSGTNLTMARGSAPAAALNAEEMTVSDVQFSVDAPQNGRPAAVTARFQLRGTPFVFRRYLRQ